LAVAVAVGLLDLDGLAPFAFDQAQTDGNAIAGQP